MQKLERRKRTFLPEQFELTNWEVISPFYTDLKNRAIESLSDLKKWLSDRSELETFISEDVGWRYILCSKNIKIGLNAF